MLDKETIKLFVAECRSFFSVIGFDGFLILASLWSYHSVDLELFSDAKVYVFMMFGFTVLTCLYILVRNGRLVRANHRLYWQIGILLSIFFIFSLTQFRFSLVDEHRLIYDSAVMTSIASERILQKVNPYSEDYFGTELEAKYKYMAVPREPGLLTAFVPTKNGIDQEINVALWHYVYLPMMFLLPVPALLISKLLFGGFDYLIFNWLFYIVAAFAGLGLVKKYRAEIFAFILLNPFILYELMLGANDLQPIAIILLGLLFLQRNRKYLSVVCMTLAVLLKQYVVFFLPFYAYKIWNATKRKKTIVLALLALGLSAAVLGPFLIWDMGAFIDDTFHYVSGKSATSYPVMGLSLGMAFWYVGILPSSTAYFPFIVIQALITIPLAVYMVYRSKGKIQLSDIVISGTFLFLVFTLLNRFAQPHYFRFMLLLFGIGAIMRSDEQFVSKKNFITAKSHE
jgi:uncharacterized membrane protein